MKFLNKIDGASQVTTDSSNRFVTDAEKTKLAGIATAATKNDTDANLKNRANHTGSQTSSTISDFAATVRTTVLTGLSTATNAVVAATDTVLVALGKLQKQIIDNLSTLTTHTGNKDNPHGVTKTHINLGNVDNTSDASKPISDATQTVLNGKVDNSRVLTDVPASAKFTDTTYGVATTSTNGLMSSTDKQNLDTNTASRHTHTNKTTLDGLSDVSGKLKYNGETVVTKTSFTWAKLKGAMSWAELIGM